MTEVNNDRNTYRWTKRRYVLILILAPALVLLFGTIAASVDPLTVTERAWLEDKGTIIFVSQTRYPPFEFVNESGNPQGMCIELMQWISTELGFKTSFRQMTFKDAQEAVLSGEVDVLTSLFYSKEREQRFDFSGMIWEVPALIFVRAERPDITTLEDLQGKRIAMQRGDYAAGFLKSRQIKYHPVPTDTFAEAADRVIEGEADAVIGDQQIVLYHLFSNKLSDQLKSVGKPLYIGRNCMGVRKGRRELIGILNKGLALARQQGVFERISHKWVGTYYTLQFSWLQRHIWHMVIAFVAVAAFAALVVVWSIRLRQTVARRTHELVESHDALRPIERDTIGRSGLEKWLWILVVLIPLYAGGDYALRHYIILPNYLSLEQEEAEKAVSCCVDAIKREIHQFGQITGAWAMWDDTYQFVQNGNMAYVNSNFRWESLLNSGIHMIYIIDLQGRVVWGGIYDPAMESEITLDEFPRDSFPMDHPLLQHKSLDGEITGIVLTENGPMLVASRPIVTSVGKGPSRGAIVMGRFLLKETIRELSRETHVRFNIKNLSSLEPDEREREILSQISPGKQIIDAVDDDVLMGYGLLTDLDGHPALLVSAVLPREIMHCGKAAARLISITVLATLTLIVVCLFAWSISFLTEIFRRQTHIEALVEERTAALRAKEQFQSDLFNGIQDGISVLNPDLTIRHVNSVMNKWYPEHISLEGKKCFECYQKANKPCEHCPILRCFDSGKTEMDVVPGPAGTDIEWLEIYGYPLKDNTTGEITGVIEFVRNITRSRQAKAELDRLVMAIEQAGDVIIITNTEGILQYANPAFEQITGYPPDEAVGQNPRILKSGKQDETFYRQLWETISSGKTWEGRFINKKKDGTFYTEEATISPVRNEAGEIVNYIAVKHDITERLRLLDEKAKLEEQYHQSQKVEGIGQLAGGVAHDLNNLLSPILGYGELLLNDFSPDDVRKRKVEQIVQAGLRARDLVRQLLAFSRKQTLDYKSVDLNIVITGFEKLLRRTIREDIDIEIIPTLNIRSVKADVGQIEQVIMNLAVNAQDAMPDGGKLIIETSIARLDEDYASVHPDVQPGDYVMLTISDTGCGMDDETGKRLFEPFFSTKGEQGTGLGLATVYGIVKQHGGNIWVYSEPDKGTIFKVYLPVSDEAAQEIKTTSEISNDLAGTETVLIVEDNDQVRDLSQAILKRRSYTVLSAENGDQALEVLDALDGPVHLLLTDVVMPGMNGKELFAKIAEKHRGLKVLYMSGYTNNIIAHRGVLEEGINFIQKPFSVQALAAKVREVLDE